MAIDYLAYCGIVKVAVFAGVTIAISSLFPNAILVLSQETILAWTAIVPVLYIICNLLEPVVVGTIAATIMVSASDQGMEANKVDKPGISDGEIFDETFIAGFLKGVSTTSLELILTVQN